MLRGSNYILIGLLAFTLLVGSVPPLAGRSNAQSRLDELRAQIGSRSSEIKKLEQEINVLNNSLADTAKQSNTLKGELDRLNSINKKLSTDIKVTEQKVAQTVLVIEKLGLEIGGKETDIGKSIQSLGEAMRILREAGSYSLMEVMLSQENLSEFWLEQDRLRQVEAGIHESMEALRRTRNGLKIDQGVAESEKQELQTLRARLADQKQINDQNKETQRELLAQTQNEEAGYRKLIASRQVQKAAFARELAAFESELKLAIDFSKLPDQGTTPLIWPLENVFITQRFGRTADSVRLYASGTHNGVDFRASVGTPIWSAASGMVVASGDTDLVCPKASYGRWVLVKHNNGLSTLYAHLSLIKVVAGQNLAAGQLVGYSGNTGYSTGPHLHFTVYASDGVQVKQLKSKVCRGTYTMPIADPKAYLDPLLYLG
ncbi:MAG: peptidoglycan DD-metalloendopeptidase family protein [Patescibacteria group bacterium]|nr:peptidoglycan DD-metalloendopeptidase family protein [Patescibacteria group bacterium]